MQSHTTALISRRRLLTLGALGVPFGMTTFPPTTAAAAEVPDMFPAQPPELVREMVAVSHGNVARVRELVQARPSLARAAWDLEFGDWEEAIGAPSPHSIPLLAHAQAGGAQALPVVRFLESLGDADWETTAPITDEERAALTGVYVYGPGATEQIEIAAVKGQLMFTRKGGSARRLFHVGDHAFHPAGPDAVRIRFSGTRAAGTTLTVHDPDVILTARTQPTSV